MTQATILISGATGTNGQALLSAFAQKGIRVRALARNLDKVDQTTYSNVDWVQADLNDMSSLDRAFTGIEKAYIVTAILPNTPELFSHFYEAAKRAGVKQLVKFSGIGAEPDSPSEVIRQHYVSDKALMDSGLNYTILRPNSFHQNMLWQAEAIKATQQFYLPLGDARQSTVDVRDLAEATVNIMTETGHLNKVYELTGPESLSFHDVAKQLTQVTGNDVSYIPVLVEAAQNAMLEQGMPAWNAQVLAEIQALFATGKYHYTTSDMEQLLGRKPTTFRQFAEDHKAYFS